METRTLKACVIDFSSGRIGSEELSAILSCATNPSVRIQQLSRDPATPAEITAAARIIAREKMEMVFVSFTAGEIGRIARLARSLESEGHRPRIFALCEPGTVPDPAEVRDFGCDHLLSAPLQREEVLARVREVAACREPANELTREIVKRFGLGRLIGRDPFFVREIEKITLLAKCLAGVLISGETGTGKELCARAVHHLGPRAKKPFIAAGCGAMPPELVENELFGHVRGAFTGADTDQNGLVGEAEGGTLFLDEIDSLPARAQAKLLRFIQEKEYKPLGSSKVRPADVRLIAATNANLEREVEKGVFRRDLYFRLMVVPIVLPPLRRRKRDIPALACHFLEKYAFEHRKGFKEFSPEALDKLVSHDWPGNIRELENTVQRAVILSKSVVLDAADIDLPPANAGLGNVMSFQEAKNRFIRTYITELLENHEGNISRAARAARKNRRAFWELMRKHDISAERFKSLSK